MPSLTSFFSSGVSLQNDAFKKMRKILSIFIVLILLFILVYSANFYFLSRLSGSINNSSKAKAFSDTSLQIDSKLSDVLNESNIKQIYKVKSSKYDPVRNKLVKNFAQCSRTLNYSEIWEEVNTVKITRL